MICQSQINFLIRKTKIRKILIFYEWFSPKYDHFKIISIGNIWISRVKWMSMIEEKNFLACFTLV